VTDQGQLIDAEVSAHQIQVEDSVLVGKENPLPVVPALGDVMGPAGNNDTSASSHQP